MKKPLLVVVALFSGAAAISIFFATRPHETTSPPGPGSRPATPRDAPDPASPGGDTPQPAAPARRPIAARPLKPIPEELQDPAALDPVPLSLALGAPPFERRNDGRILKRDVVNSAGDLNDPAHEPVADLQILASVVGAYHTIFRQNPVAGENREVVEALTGKNLYNLAFIDPAHPAINEHGELVDRWDVPYRFHPISRDKMEISSAGEDGMFGTGDDVVVENPVVIGDRGPET